MKRQLSKRAAVNIEPALTRILKLVDDRLAAMTQNMMKASAANVMQVILAESQKASSDLNTTITTEIRRVEQTLNTITDTDTDASSINNPFNVAPAGPAAPAPGSGGVGG